MVAKRTAGEQASLNFNENECCSFLRSEMCYLIYELKSMMEIINILKEETRYDRTVNRDQRTYSECEKKTYNDLLAIRISTIRKSVRIST